MIEIKDLGNNCRRCLCSVYKRRKTCQPMEGTVDEYCDKECLGKEKMIEKCNSFSKRI